MLDNYDGFKTIYAKLILSVSGITLEVRPTGRRSGIGVFTCEDIPEDTFIMTFAGSGPVVAKNCGYENQNQFQISETHSIVITNFAARFMNHSCNPNCGHLHGTELYSIQPIAKGGELVYDYSCAMAGDAEIFECHCGHRWCRGRIGNFAEIEDDWRKHYYIEAGIVSPHNLIEPIELGPTVADARLGDRIRIARAGSAGSDLEFEVEEMSRYNSRGGTATELGGRSARGWVFLEWQDEHPVFTLSADEQSRSLAEVGLSEPDLLRLAQGSSPDAAIELDGRTFRYEGSGKVRCLDVAQGDQEQLLAWEFEAEDGAGSLSIEQWQDKAPEVSVGTYVTPLDVQVEPRKQKKRKKH